MFPLAFADEPLTIAPSLQNGSLQRGRYLWCIGGRSTLTVPTATSPSTE